MKKSVRRMAATLLVLCLLPATALAAAINVTVDGTAVAFPDAAPFIDENGRTLVPLRAVADAMGLTVEWDSYSRTATFSKSWTDQTAPLHTDTDGDGVAESYPTFYQIAFSIGSSEYETVWASAYQPDEDTGELREHIGGGWMNPMDTQAIIKDGRTYAPIRYLAESFFYDVAWDSASKTVKVMPYQPYKYHCYYDVAPLSVMIENRGGLTAASVTSVQVTVDEGEPFNVPFTAYTEAQIDKDKVKGYDVLTGASTSYQVEAGHTYYVDVTFAATKSNGADTTQAFRFTYTA